MTQFVDVVLLVALALAALAWALDLGSRKIQLMTMTGVVLALNVEAIWQEGPWYVVVIYGALLGLLLQALRRESVRRKAAERTVSKPTA